MYSLKYLVFSQNCERYKEIESDQYLGQKQSIETDSLTKGLKTATVNMLKNKVLLKTGTDSK